jgi:hypothetical protein
MTWPTPTRPGQAGPDHQPGTAVAAYPAGRGRVDLAVEADGDEQMLVIIEIKGTDWDAIPADRVLRNLRQQLQAYLDTVIEDMEAGRKSA